MTPKNCCAAWALCGTVDCCGRRLCSSGKPAAWSAPTRNAHYLRHETHNPELGTLFRSADSLHANFYDDQYERRQLEDGLADAKKLIALLDDADAAVPQDAPLPRGLRRLTPASGD